MTRHTIGIVSKLTGLKPDVIRAWERRYQAIEPLRTETNRRYYTDEQVERLKLMHRATISGRQIGQIANLSTEELRQLVQSDQQALSQVPGAKKDVLKPELEERLEGCISAIKNLDAIRFKQLLDSSLVEFTQVRVLEALIGPLLERIGISYHCRTEHHIGVLSEGLPQRERRSPSAALSERSHRRSEKGGDAWEVQR